MGLKEPPSGLPADCDLVFEVELLQAGDDKARAARLLPAAAA